jgi:hypothetical protein
MPDNIKSHQARSNPPRASSLASGSHKPTNFSLENPSVYAVDADDIPGKHHPLELSERVDHMRDVANHVGFISLFDAALAEARRHGNVKFKAEEDMLKFVEYGCFSELVALFQESGSFGKVINGNVITNPLPDSLVSIMSQNLYRQEWRTLLDTPTTLNRSFENFTPEDVENFDFGAVFEELKENAPNLLALFECLAVDRGPGAYKEIVMSERQKIFLVEIIAVLAKLKNGTLNYIQGIIGLYLYACKTTKRVITTLNHMGISASYDAILNCIDRAAISARARLKTIGPAENAFQVSFDNLTIAMNAKNITVLNKKRYKIFTSGFVLLTPSERTHRFFTAEDVNIDAIKTMNAMDFYPTQAEAERMEEIFRALILDTLLNWLKDRERPIRTELSDETFPMPSIFQLDFRQVTKICTLPTYDLDENKLQEMTQIIEEIAKDVGLTPEQCKKIRLLYKGDFLTVRNIR